MFGSAPGLWQLDPRVGYPLARPGTARIDQYTYPAGRRMAALTRTQVTKAGRVLVAYLNDTTEPDDNVAMAYRLARQWRTSHSYPLRLVTPGVRYMVNHTAPGGAVAQRLKRLPQIMIKLSRFPSMRLPQMEDIDTARDERVNRCRLEDGAANQSKRHAGSVSNNRRALGVSRPLSVRSPRSRIFLTSLEA